VAPIAWDDVRYEPSKLRDDFLCEERTILRRHALDALVAAIVVGHFDSCDESAVSPERVDRGVMDHVDSVHEIPDFWTRQRGRSKLFDVCRAVNESRSEGSSER